MNKPQEFWIVNISKRNVCLADLSLTVPKGRSWNLLDPNHFRYTLEQLEKSAQEGSLFKKNHLVKVRNVPPQIIVKPGIYVINSPRDAKLRSQVFIEEKHYEELTLSDEEFAQEFVNNLPDTTVNLPQIKKK